MRLARDADELAPALHAAQPEAKAAFGNDARLPREATCSDPRHIEIQVLADKHGNAVHLGERDCSIQRRNQKFIEEAPSPALTPEVASDGRRCDCGGASLSATLVWARSSSCRRRRASTSWR